MRVQREVRRNSNAVNYFHNISTLYDSNTSYQYTTRSIKDEAAESIDSWVLKSHYSLKYSEFDRCEDQIKRSNFPHPRVPTNQILKTLTEGVDGTAKK